MSENRKTVFISYSWDNTEHQEWVLKLATDLMEEYGVKVILDQFELSAGRDLTYFMEQSIEKADKVLIILTPNYKVRAEERKSGVGYESLMITQEIFESPITKIKFLPILRIGDSKASSPRFLKSKVYHNMVDDKVYYTELLKLAKLIHDQPAIKMPKLGAIPNFDEPTFDPIIDTAKELTIKIKINQELNQIIDSYKGTEIFKNEIEVLNVQLKEKVELYKNSTGLNFVFESDDNCTSVIRCEKISIQFNWDVKYANTAKNAYLEEMRVNGIISIMNNRFYYNNSKPKLLRKTEYNFDLDYSKNVIWKNEKTHYSTTEIIKNAFVFLIGEVNTEFSKNFRK